MLTQAQVLSSTLTPAHQEKVEKVIAFVQAARTRDGVTPTTEKPSELSGIAHGEGFVHLNSLISSDFESYWASLLNPTWGEGQCDDIIGAFPRIA